MPKYSVKIGVVHLESDKPITMAERKAAAKELKSADALIVTKDGLVVKLSVDCH
jgi:hypothetical protein